MLKYYNSVFAMQEFPGEVSLVFNITNCPYRCPGCHSTHLWKDTGTPLTTNEIDRLVELSKGQGVDITCIGFMGGDMDTLALRDLLVYINTKYPGIKTGWYSGSNFWSGDEMDFERDGKRYHWDYVKFGSYQRELGGLDSPITNQVMYMYVNDVDKWLDITVYFKTKNQDERRFIRNINKTIHSQESDADKKDMFDSISQQLSKISS